DAGVRGPGKGIDCRRSSVVDGSTMERGVNPLPPEDIAVAALEPAADSFHARFSATGRTYEYRIRTARTRDPLERRREQWLPATLDRAAMRQASAQLIGRRDLAAFAPGRSAGRRGRR